MNALLAFGGIMGFTIFGMFIGIIIGKDDDDE